MKQNDTVIDETIEDLKTEFQNNLIADSNQQQILNTDVEMNYQNLQNQQFSIFSRQIEGGDQSQNDEDGSKMNINQNPANNGFIYDNLQNDFIVIDSQQNKLEIMSAIDGVGHKIQKYPKRLIRAINLLVNVKSFYRLLTKNSRILGKLTKDQHDLINDFSSVFQNQEQKTFLFLYQLPKIKKTIQKISQCLNSILEFIPIFQPYSIYKFIWDILQAILILSVMFLFSLITFFQLDPKFCKQFFQIVFVLFVLDMLFTFNTGIVEKGNVIFDRKKAVIVYLKKNFIMDQIALLPLFMFFLNIELEGLYSQIIYFQILMKLFVLMDIFDRLTFYLNYQKNMKNIVDLVKLVFIISCVCHVFCLFWHGLAIYEIKQGSDKTWLQVRDIQEANVFTRYVQSFYYLAVTMITVGYGDITPQTTYEILFTTLTMFVTGLFYAFSLNRIGSIIDNIELKDKAYKENMQVIHRLMREENVSQTLRVQISNYLQYLYKESNEVGKQQEKEIIDKLSKQLKYGLIQEVQGKYLKEIEFIDKLETKSKIVEIMEECLFSPGEYIFQQGDQDDSALYYIVKGSVKIIYEYQDRNQTQGLLITQLNKYQYFGDMQFIQGNARILTAQASDFCRTYKIPREQFFKCIKQSEYDLENFQMLKEAYIFKDNQKLFKMKCYTCNKTDHISIRCPKTHLTLSKQTLIQKENKITPHLERKYVQRRYQKINSLTQNNIIINTMFQFLDKDDNYQDLQQLEEQLNLSNDEAYIEQQLIDLQYLDEQLLEDHKYFEQGDEENIEQDKEQENYDRHFQKNDIHTSKSLKQTYFSICSTNQQRDQKDETESFDNSDSEQSDQTNLQKQLTNHKTESRCSIFDQLVNILHQKDQAINNEQNSSMGNITSKSQKSQQKQKQLISSPKNVDKNCEYSDKNFHQKKENKNKVSDKQRKQNLDIFKKGFLKKKSQSLTFLQNVKQNESKNTQSSNKHTKSISRSLSFDNSSFNEANKQLNQQTVPKQYQQKNLASAKEIANKQSEYQNSYHCFASNTNFSKQNINQNNSQSTIKYLKNNEITINNQQQNFRRRQSKKLTNLSQKLQQKRASQIINPLIQHPHLSYNQNMTQKNKNKLQNQINYSYSAQDQIQNMIRKRKSIAQNQLNNNNQNQNMFQQIIQLISNSPLVAERRQTNLSKNIIKKNPPKLAKNKNQSSMQFDLESCKIQPEISKNQSLFSYDMNNKEYNRKSSQQTKFEKNKYCQSKSENRQQSQIQVHLMDQNNILLQENQYVDMSYLMLQIFERANIFRFYHPNYNINVVIKNLKQKDTKSKFKKPFKSQAPRQKKLHNLSNIYKVNEKCIKSNLSKDSEINKNII